MKLISDPDIVINLCEKAKGLIEDPSAFRLSSLKQKGWLAVPTTKEGRLFRSEFEYIVGEAGQLRCTRLYAIPLDFDEGAEYCVEMDISIDDFDDFYAEYGFCNFLLFPDCQKFAILSTVYDYNVVAASKEVLERILRRKVEDMEADFQDFADSLDTENGSDFVRREQARYLGILKKYRALHDTY
jgi:hypothetical protein